MRQSSGLSRRAVLGGGAIGGLGLVLGFRYINSRRNRAAAARPEAFEPNAFLRIAEDGEVTAIIGAAEMGQGIYTALAMVLADELDVPWEKISVEAAPADPAFANPFFQGIQATAASTSVAVFYDTTRQAAAAARKMLVDAACAQWKVAANECHTDNGRVLGPNGRSLPYRALVKEAAKIAYPSKEQIILRKTEDLGLTGRSMRRIETPKIVKGQLTYGLDFQAPNMLTAVVARSPYRNGKLLRYKREEALKVTGVLAILEIPSGVAVVAEGYWAALKARSLLQPEWSADKIQKFSSADLLLEYQEMADTPGRIAVKKGEALPAEGKVEAEYSIPYLAHAPMEPLNCTIQAEGGVCEVWVGTQYQSLDKKRVSEILGYKPDNVMIHTLYMGGGFGRRASPTEDVVVETAEIVKALNAQGGGLARRPVKNIWPREDDIQGGFYRPMAYNRISAVVDAQGMPSHWLHRIVEQSPMTGNEFRFLVEKGIDATSVAGARDIPYSIPNLCVELHSPENGPTVQWMRSVGNVNTCFAIESFIDELAHRHSLDPLEYRRKLLQATPENARLLKVLDVVAQKSNWSSPLPERRGRGVAVQDYWGTKVAQVAEVSVDGNMVHVHHVFCAIDCGLVINPLGVTAQVEGGIIFGLSAAAYGLISFEGGLTEQSNFHDYPILRMSAAPEISVELVSSDAPPGGVGEAAVPHIAAAICNAIFAASGRRVRHLPLSAQGVSV